MKNVTTSIMKIHIKILETISIVINKISKFSVHDALQ